jgi:ribonuclease R
MKQLEQRILDYLARPGYTPIKPATLAKRLKLAKQQRETFEAAVDRLVEDGRILAHGKGRLRLPTGQGLFAGIIKRTSRGSGYVRPHEPIAGADPDDHADVHVSERDCGDAQTGDEVLVRLLAKRGPKGARTGRVEEIVERASTTFVGTYFEDRGQGWVQIDGDKFAEAIRVGDPGAKGVQPEDKVVVEMLRFPDHRREGEGVLVQVLGPRGTPGVDTQTVIHEFGIPEEFPEAVLAEARERVRDFSEEDLGDRLDLTGETVVTIDPVDARDFDDAISLTRDEKSGHWTLGVHIADVAHFVTPGSRLDEEARKRGNSVYLPRHVIPMLPEILSNGVCSLQPDRVRYTKTAFIEYTRDGVPVSTRFANSAIRSKRRFAYEEVMPILADPEKHAADVPREIHELLVDMHDLAMLLRKRRFAAGALELHMPEVELEFDVDNRVTGAHEAHDDESHEIIEEFMLAANVAVATEFADRGIAFVRRTHGDPDEVKLNAFKEFVQALGYKLELPRSREHLQRLIEEVKGTPVERAVNFGLLRSMKRAEYRGIEMGHFALAEEHYCHFTSPIRRYPDLDVHRLLDAISIKRRKKFTGESDVELEKLGRHCSTTERRAEAAERELVKIKLLTYMEGRVGDTLEALVTGVENFGIFCQGIEVPIEGLVHISALARDDYFDFDKSLHALTARRSGEVYRLGDRVTVRVARVDVDRRQLDLQVVEHAPQETGGPPARTKETKPRGGASFKPDRDGGKPGGKPAKSKSKGGQRRRK